jgi:hypothetical protein
MFPPHPYLLPLGEKEKNEPLIKGITLKVTMYKKDEDIWI